MTATTSRPSESSARRRLRAEAGECHRHGPFDLAVVGVVTRFFVVGVVGFLVVGVARLGFVVVVVEVVVLVAANWRRST